MRIIRNLTGCILVSCAACLSVFAQSANEVFQLPDGQVREAYQVDMEAVLRDRHRRKIETGVNGSILQWSIIDGDLPAGLTVRTDGNVAGTPETAREHPYVFRVKVVDRAIANQGFLLISFSVVIAPPRLRLTHIEGPALVPIDSSAPPPRGNGPQLTDAAEISPPDGSRVSVTTPESEAKNDNRLPAPAADVAASPSGSSNILKKITRAVGLEGDDGGGGVGDTKAKGCDNGSKARRAVSDEAHNPLEGDTSTQNTCVEFRNLNTLKYRVEFNTKTTRTEGPDLSTLPFLPKIPSTTATVASQANTTSLALRDQAPTTRNIMESELKELDRRFNIVSRNLNTQENSLRGVENLIDQRVTDVQNAHTRSMRLSSAADYYLQSNNVTALLQEVKQTKGTVGAAQGLEWPAAQLTTEMDMLNNLTLAIETLRSKHPEDPPDISQEVWSEWIVANQDRYSRVRDRIAELKTKINTINGGATAFNDARNVLAGWLLVLKNVHKQGEKAFKQEAFVSCQTDEGEAKSSLLTITKSIEL